MLYFSLQNARGGRKKQPRLRGGLRTDGFMLRSFSDHARNGLGSAAHCKSRFICFTKFLSHFGRSFFVAGAVVGEVRR